MDYYPLGKAEALARGYTWYDDMETRNLPPTTTTFPSDRLPKKIDDVSDDIVNKIIICQLS